MKNLILILLASCLSVILAKSPKASTLQKINSINNAQSSWEAGYTEFSDLSVHEMKRYLGAMTLQDNVKRRETKVVANLPRQFDARYQWSGCPSISSISDQGNCGSCWAVSTADAASNRLCIGSNYQVRLNLSAQNLLACCSKCAPDGGCNGGWPNLAWDFLMNPGLVTGGAYGSYEGCQPYEIYPTGRRASIENAGTPPCRNYCTNSYYSNPYSYDFHYGESSYRVYKDVAQIQSDLYYYGPSVAIFSVYDDFQNYRSGIYYRTSNKYVGKHAVRLIGWGTENGIDYWLFANSWNTGFGERGNFRIRRGVNECGIEDSITGGVIRK